MMTIGKERPRVPDSWQSGDLLKEGKAKEERKDMRVGNKTGSLSSHV